MISRKLLNNIVHSQVTALIILTASFFLTYFGWKISSDAVLSKARKTFEYNSEELVKDIEHRLVIYEQVFVASRSFVKINDGLQSEKWAQYIADQNIQKAFPGIQGVGFAKFMPANSRATFERQMSKKIGRKFKIHPEGDRSWYTSIIALEPFDWRNQRAFGFDMFAEEVRHKAMERAIVSNSTSMSGLVKLVQETNKDVQNGFLVYIPYFTKDVSSLSFQDKLKYLDGFIYAPFRINDFLRGISNDISSGLNFEIYDLGFRQEALLFKSISNTDIFYNQFYFEKLITFGGHQWRIRTISTPEFLSEQFSILPYLIAILGVVVDIFLFYIIYSMERMRKFQILKFSAEAAEKANRAKTEFLSNVSHEIRTPMNGILGMCEILEDSGLNNDQRDNLRVIQESAQSLMNLINEILNFSSIESGKTFVEISSFNLRNFVEDNVKILMPIASKKNINIHWSVDARLPQEINSDREKLGQVLLNIMSNAIKFTESGYVELLVKDSGDRKICFEVLDTGIGVRKNQVKDIFKAFVQGDASTKRLYGGTGLGLYISKRIVQLLGGSLNYEPGPKLKGSKFFFEIPLSSQKRIEESDAAASGDVQITTMKNFEEMRVLVVDDNHLNRLILVKFLQRIGILRVDHVESGIEAVKFAKATAYDLVLLDCQMPIMDGYETSAHLRRLGFSGSIIAVTANALKDVEEKCLEAGMDAMLTKPVVFEDFHKKIKIFLNLNFAKKSFGTKSS